MTSLDEIYKHKLVCTRKQQSDPDLWQIICSIRAPLAVVKHLMSGPQSIWQSVTQHLQMSVVIHALMSVSTSDVGVNIRCRCQHLMSVSTSDVGESTSPQLARISRGWNTLQFTNQTIIKNWTTKTEMIYNKAVVKTEMFRAQTSISGLELETIWNRTDQLKKIRHKKRSHQNKFLYT